MYVGQVLEKKKKISRKKYQKGNYTTARDESKKTYYVYRNRYKEMIIEKKKKYVDNFFEGKDGNDPWGRAYKIIKLKRKDKNVKQVVIQRDDGRRRRHKRNRKKGEIEK